MNIDYFMLDNSLASTYKQVKDIIAKKNNKIIVLTRIGDLQTLRYIDNITANSAGVELAMNYFCKQLSYMEVSIIP
jgi:hypothetical protein